MVRRAGVSSSHVDESDMSCLHLVSMVEHEIVRLPSRSKSWLILSTYGKVG